jgi:hypothetical protein
MDRGAGAPSAAWGAPQGTEPEEAGRSFEAALELAKQQSSVSFELRAAMSLCRFRRGAKKRQALGEVRRILGTFAEGHDTGDLATAKALLVD